MSKTLRKTLNNISYFIGLERFGSLLSKQVFWQADTESKKIALTFDDGPHSIYTPQILEILNDFAIPATFFLIGSNVRSQPEIAEQILQSGYQIGNHTYTHPNLTKLENHQIEFEILETKKEIENTCGVTTHLMRPPYGLFNKKTLRIIDKTNHKAVIGDVYPRDTTLPGSSKIVKRVISRTRKGSVIILHDGVTYEGMKRSQTVTAVRELIPLLQNNGFTFVSLIELIDSGNS